MSENSARNRMKLRIGTQKKETKSSTKSVRLAARLQKALKEKVGETEAIQANITDLGRSST
ncbi:MAG: hypothetical protein WB988_16860 [Candidatus Nitrosopolaris sp.]